MCEDCFYVELRRHESFEVVPCFPVSDVLNGTELLGVGLLGYSQSIVVKLFLAGFGVSPSKKLS